MPPPLPLAPLKVILYKLKFIFQCSDFQPVLDHSRIISPNLKVLGKRDVRHKDTYPKEKIKLPWSPVSVVPME